MREDTNLLDIAIQEPPQHRVAEATRTTRYQYWFIGEYGQKFIEIVCLLELSYLYSCVLE